jgi:predicted DNA-binding protein (UPF0251 family)
VLREHWRTSSGTEPAVIDETSVDPWDEREVLLLVAWDQLTVAEAAKVLGVPQGTARSRLARATLRRVLSECGPHRAEVSG